MRRLKALRDPGVKLKFGRLPVEAEIGARVELQVRVDEEGRCCVGGNLLAGAARIPVPLPPELSRKGEARAGSEAEIDELRHRRMVTVPTSIGPQVEFGSEGQRHTLSERRVERHCDAPLNLSIAKFASGRRQLHERDESDL